MALIKQGLQKMLLNTCRTGAVFSFPKCIQVSLFDQHVAGGRAA